MLIWCGARFSPDPSLVLGLMANELVMLIYLTKLPALGSPRSLAAPSSPLLLWSIFMLKPALDFLSAALVGEGEAE